ncbi:peptidase M13 [Lactiplantibacillus garii]|uniref:Peptidase M13 n=1 Tax=Lactiplantibacillus garii TaxID=2306423 RepID=A0A3R8J6M7_9LACO|nr:alpha/beta hydrolase family protein [Lactiplantibacillus garii]RRK10190.1 peptidase M13 [Lactiplantibacillus garii]
MSLHQTTFYSNELQMNTTAVVILPESKVGNDVPLQAVDHRLPVVWLLHGLFDDESMFLRYTSIERYASDTGFAVVMPRAERSFYTDMAAGGRYWHFITEELPQRMRFFYPLSLDPHKNFVAGASMGGYGAYKWAFTHPDRFAAVAALSGVMDVTQFGQDNPNLVPDWSLIFSQTDLHETPADINYLATHLPQNQLHVLQTVGTEDFLYQMNQAIRPVLATAFKERYTYLEGPGNHDFKFWDHQLPTIMDWFKTILLNKEGTK